LTVFTTIDCTFFAGLDGGGALCIGGGGGPVATSACPHRSHFVTSPRFSAPHCGHRTIGRLSHRTIRGNDHTGKIAHNATSNQYGTAEIVKLFKLLVYANPRNVYESRRGPFHSCHSSARSTGSLDHPRGGCFRSLLASRPGLTCT